MTITHAHSLDTPRIPAALGPTRAISLWQPWASLVFVTRPRLKEYETRHWATDYRGPLVIHAALKLVTDLDRRLIRILSDEFGGHWAKDLPRGAVLGVVDLAACRDTIDLYPSDVEELTGNWEPGRYAWRLDNPRLFHEPVPAKGRQGFFTWPQPTTDAERLI